MMLQYQRFQLGGRVEEVEIETHSTTGRQYILLRDVQDVFPTASRFERDGKPVRFLSDEQGHRLEPWRIACHLETTLQVIPAKQNPFPNGDLAFKNATALPNHPTMMMRGSNQGHTPPMPLLAPSSNSIVQEEDWREYLLQRAVRMLILCVASIFTVLLNHIVSSWMRHGSVLPMMAMYWRVVSMVLFVLSVAWFMMLVYLVIQVVWFFLSTPIATKRSMYQRLFDF